MTTETCRPLRAAAPSRMSAPRALTRRALLGVGSTVEAACCELEAALLTLDLEGSAAHSRGGFLVPSGSARVVGRYRVRPDQE